MDEETDLAKDCRIELTWRYADRATANLQSPFLSHAPHLPRDTWLHGLKLSPPYSLVIDHVCRMKHNVHQFIIQALFFWHLFLDRRALQYLLELRSPLQRGRPRIAQRALIICVTVDPGEANDSKFGKMVNDVSELRLAWTEPLTIDLMDAAEFQEVLLILIRRNLRTVFAADVDQDQLIQEAAEWTQAEWSPITSQLVPLIDEELGPAKRDESRILTNKVWERVRKRWQKRQW